MGTSLKQLIQDEARRLGFILAGVTTPDPPPHISTFEAWLTNGRHAGMQYLDSQRSRTRRADPGVILPGCRSILVLAIPYSKPASERQDVASNKGEPSVAKGRVAAYAWGKDYHEVIPERMKELVSFIEAQVRHPVSHRWYTDTGPILERDLAQRAGLGWIGKNTCLINPKIGSYFLLAELFLDVELEPDRAFTTDHCGTCTRCLDACPTDCILRDRTIDAGRCISYLTIELKADIPPSLRPAVGDWVFGCDICQMVCPWNRFAPSEGDPAFAPQADRARPDLIYELRLLPPDFARKFKGTPLRRPKQAGYLRNVAVALGNTGNVEHLTALEASMKDPNPLVREHAGWAISQIKEREGQR